MKKKIRVVILFNDPYRTNLQKELTGLNSTKAFGNYQFVVAGSANNIAEFEKCIDPNFLPDLAIVQFKSTKPESFKAARWLKETYPAVKILVLSMYKDTWMPKAIKRYSIDCYLALSQTDLEELVSTIISLFPGESNS